MFVIRVTLCIGMSVGGALPAAAAWLRCTQAGRDARGPFAMITSVVDVGDTTRSDVGRFQRLLAAYTTKNMPDASERPAECSMSDDLSEAVDRYNRSWSAANRQYGWGRAILVPPSAWLSGSGLKSVTGEF